MKTEQSEQEPLMITPGGGAFPFAVVGKFEQVKKLFTKPEITEEEAWEIWKACGKLAGVDYYEYALKIIEKYKEKTNQ